MTILKSKPITYILPALLLICTFLVSTFLTYHQVYIEVLYKLSGSVGRMGYNSDTLEHISFLKEFFNGEQFIPHPLWHIGVKIISFITPLSVENSAILFSSFLITFWVFLVYITTNSLLKKSYPNKEYLYILVTIIIVTIAPLNLPFYDKFIFLGQGSPNIWHNVTLWTVKPFSLLTILFTLKALRLQNIKLYTYAILFAILSLFAKPSFIIIFIPSLILLMITKKYFSKTQILFLATLIFISFGILLYQMIFTFSAESSIIFDFLGVWSLNSKNIIISMLLSLAFPLTFTLLHRQSLQNEYIVLAWLQTFFGIILFMCFAESGPHYSHGNFSWSYMIALSLLYLFTIIEFIKIFPFLQLWKKIVLSFIFIIQSYTGLFYFYKILKGYHPLYIGFFL